MIYLASVSPRRRELIKKITDEFLAVPPEGEEVDGGGKMKPEEVAVTNACAKAKSVFEKTGATVIGADTIVVLKGKIIGKPKDDADAIKTLKALRNKRHTVITGVNVIGEKGSFWGCCKSYVKINPLTDEFIYSYVKSKKAFDKAGSYGIQDEGLVKRLYGDRDNVIGFPVKLVKKLLGLCKL